jgi:hypothetical protein
VNQACACLVSLLVAAPLAAQDAPAAPPAADAFDILVLPARVDPALDLWTHVPAEVAPTFPVIDSLSVDEMVSVLVFLKNIGDDGHGAGRVTLDFAQVLADGSEDMQQAGLVAWEGPLPTPGIVALSRATLGIGFDAEEPLGPMNFRVTARDEASGVAVEKRFDLTLVAWSYGSVPESLGDCTAWYDRYHTAPQPAQAVRAFLEYADLRQSTGELNGALVGFFRTLFLDQPWLLPQLVSAARGGDEARLAKTATLLHCMGRDDLLAELYPAERLDEVCASLAPVVLPDPYGPLALPLQLDLLWGEFLASGRYAPVRQVVRALALVEPADPVSVYQAGKQTDEDKAVLMRGLAARSAAWSLHSNMKQHPLLFHYGLWMLQHEDLAPRERDMLRGTLKLVQDEKKAAHGEQPPP